MAGSQHDATGGRRAVVERTGARVLLVDDAGRLLLLKGHDPHLPSRTWWFTPGGGLEAGEDFRAAAARELAEETGWRVEPFTLVGPVWRRTAVFDFMSTPYVQHEQFFVAHCADAVDTGQLAWTSAEDDTVDEIAWLTQAELAAAAIEVFPAQLRDDWSTWLRWDGVTREFGEVPE